MAQEIKALTELVAKLSQPTEPVHGRVKGSQEGDPPEGVSSPEPAPEPRGGTPKRLTRADPVEQAETNHARRRWPPAAIGPLAMVVPVPPPEVAAE